MSESLAPPPSYQSAVNEKFQQQYLDTYFPPDEQELVKSWDSLPPLFKSVHHWKKVNDEWQASLVNTRRLLAPTNFDNYWKNIIKILNEKNIKARFHNGGYTFEWIFICSDTPMKDLLSAIKSNSNSKV